MKLTKKNENLKLQQEKPGRLLFSAVTIQFNGKKNQLNVFQFHSILSVTLFSQLKTNNKFSKKGHQKKILKKISTSSQAYQQLAQKEQEFVIMMLINAFTWKENLF